MTDKIVIATSHLGTAVSFGGGGGGGGGGSSDRQSRRNDFHRNRNANRTPRDFSGVVDTLGDALIGNPGDNPDMGAMSDANRGMNSRPTFGGGGFGGRGGGGK